MSFMTALKNTLTLDEINKLAAGNPAELMQGADAAFSEQIARASRVIAKKASGHKIVMVTGPTASGKTTSSFMVKDELERLGVRAVTLSLDNFFLSKEEGPKLPDGSHDYENVKALDITGVQDALKRLFEVGECQVPVFDFKSGRPSDRKLDIVLGEGDAVIVEGIHALNPIFTEQIPSQNVVKVHISVAQGISDGKHEIFSARTLRFIRRMVRDNMFRGAAPEKTFEMWERACLGELHYIDPFSENVDIRIDSLHLYEPCVFAEPASALLNTVGKGSLFYKEARRVFGLFEGVWHIPLDMMSKRSLLREFVGGGIYSY